MQPAIGTPCNTDELIARVSSTSMLSLRSVSQDFPGALGDRQRIPASIKGRLTATTTGLALKAISSDTVGQRQREIASGNRGRSRIGRRLGWCGFGTRAASNFLNSVRLVSRKRLQQGAQQRLMRRVIFQNKAGAIVIDASRLDSGLGAEFQPEKGLGWKRTLVTQGGNIEPNTPRHRMTDREFHSITIQNF